MLFPFGDDLFSAGGLSYATARGTTFFEPLGKTLVLQGGLADFPSSWEFTFGMPLQRRIRSAPKDQTNTRIRHLM